MIYYLILTIIYKRGDMMIIDAHTHTFPEKIAKKTIDFLQDKAQSVAYTEGTDNALKRSMQNAGIDVSVILPVSTNVGQVEKLNDIAINKNEVWRETGLFSLGCMHPDYENFAAELKRLKSNGITGIKLHPAYQNTDIDDIKFLRIIDVACAEGLAVVIHAGLDIGIMHHNFASVNQIENVIKEIAPEKFVLAHMGGWKGWNEVEKELCGENVYFDTSFSLGEYEPPENVFVPEEKRKMLTKEQFKKIVEKHGYNKILFGSDSPWSEQKSTIEKIKNCGLDEEKLDLIFGLNAQKLFGIA